VAYVYDPARTFGQRVNLGDVDVEPLDPDDSLLVRELVQRHQAETDSTVAERLLESWDTEVLEFVKVMPRDYRRILEATRLAEAQGRSVEEAVMEAAHG
jgi:glutamate synthase (NADPH/NADH) large chain